LEKHLASKQSWLVFTDDNGIGAAMAHRLRAFGQEVTEVHRGEVFQDRGDGSLQLVHAMPEDMNFFLQP